jgi:hypothetical protein
MRMRDRYGVLSLACASVYVCVRMFSARSVNGDDEGGNNSCDKILLSSLPFKQNEFSFIDLCCHVCRSTFIRMIDLHDATMSVFYALCLG